jgi:hypothetical protein
LKTSETNAKGVPTVETLPSYLLVDKNSDQPIKPRLLKKKLGRFFFNNERRAEKYSGIAIRRKFPFLKPKHGYYYYDINEVLPWAMATGSDTKINITRLMMELFILPPSGTLAIICIASVWVDTLTTGVTSGILQHCSI